MSEQMQMTQSDSCLRGPPRALRASKRDPRGSRRPIRMTPVLETTNLRVTFGTSVAAVRGVSLTVNRGETHCLVGESGCGKSVTALAVMGLLPRSAHRTADVLRFHDLDLTRLRNAAWRGCAATGWR